MRGIKSAYGVYIFVCICMLNFNFFDMNIVFKFCYVYRNWLDCYWFM